MPQRVRLLWITQILCLNALTVTASCDPSMRAAGNVSTTSLLATFFKLEFALGLLDVPVLCAPSGLFTAGFFL